MNHASIFTTRFLLFFTIYFEKINLLVRFVSEMFRAAAGTRLSQKLKIVSRTC